jgi:hypothetical protein
MTRLMLFYTSKPIMPVVFDDWLRTQDSRMILLQQARVFADDPALEEIRKTIYENRGRSELDAD